MQNVPSSGRREGGRSIASEAQRAKRQRRGAGAWRSGNGAISCCALINSKQAAAIPRVSRMQGECSTLISKEEIREFPYIVQEAVSIGARLVPRRGGRSCRLERTCEDRNQFRVSRELMVHILMEPALLCSRQPVAISGAVSNEMQIR